MKVEVCLERWQWVVMGGRDGVVDKENESEDGGEARNGDEMKRWRSMDLDGLHGWKMNHQATGRGKVQPAGQSMN